MKPITADGFFNTTHNEYEVNMSGIFSYLIRECGKLVEDYNADILYDFKTITDFIKAGNDDCGGVFWIGLRDSGVDHEEFIKYRCENDYYYRGLYKIVVEKKDGKCSVVMTKESAWDFRKEHGIVK